MEKRVMVFTASGTFRGAHGTIEERTRDGARVKIDGERLSMVFSAKELVALDAGPHHAGAE